ncbi:MAG: YcgN family cysteine cluster protein [Pseudomonadota bacterium]
MSFWKKKDLTEFTHEEWESICDGCAKCCLQQLEDDATNQLVFTNVACDLLDNDTCRCTDYPNRSTRVPACMTITPENIKEIAEFAPPSCAYRLLAIGEDLPVWHPLVTGDAQSTIKAGKSVRDRVIPLRDANQDDFEEYIVYWPEQV